MRVLFIVFFCLGRSLAFSSLLDEMSLEEKIGQLFLVHFIGDEVNEEARTLVQDVQVGGILYYNWANGLTSPEQVRKLSLGLQKLAAENPKKIPLLLAVDQEGGVVNRLSQGFTVFPGNQVLGKSLNSKISYEVALAMGKELRAVGVCFNLAPVVDIHFDSDSSQKISVMGIRSFGDNPETVTAHAKEMLKGFHEAGVITSLKHFPGIGDVRLDPHEDLPLLEKTKEELLQKEFIPFQALALETDTIMTAHVLLPFIDSKHCATLSPSVLRILREDIGFEKGVIVSDSLNMDGIRKNCTSLQEASLQAFEAGCDLLILGGKQLTGAYVGLEIKVEDVVEIQNAFVEAIRNGRILERRLNESVQRILDLKERYSLFLEEEDLKERSQEIRSPQSLTLAQSIASQAIEVVCQAKSFPFLQGRKPTFFVPIEVREDMLFLQKEFPHFDISFFSSSPTPEEREDLEKKAREADLLIIGTYNVWKMQAQAAWIHSLLQKPSIVVALRDPTDAIFFPQADLLIKTYSPSYPSLFELCNVLYELIFPHLLKS